jgi:SAM-dependent methyltransferase
MPALSHNHEKKYIIPDREPCDFLIRLGVMDLDGQVFQKHYAKFRQINRFLEIVSDVLDSLPEKTAPLRIVDFGCGKAYLTFALYHYLKRMSGRNVEITGLDLKEDVIDFCNGVTCDLNYEGLRFLKGDIAEYSEQGKADMVVTLHACDTATDYALIKAVGWGASVILSVPCCQHELFSQISNELHAPLLKHGILNERFCSILTDGLRGLKLEESGYDVSMIEFTSLEHTSKNIMIRAVKTSRKSKTAGEEYRRLKDYWHVNPTIDQLD